MKLRQARKILKRKFEIETKLWEHGTPRPKNYGSILTREIKACAVVNHSTSLGRTTNWLNNKYMAKIHKELKAKNPNLFRTKPDKNKKTWK
jgi:hypothetical protein